MLDDTTFCDKWGKPLTLLEVQRMLAPVTSVKPALEKITMDTHKKVTIPVSDEIESITLPSDESGVIIVNFKYDKERLVIILEGPEV